MKKEVMKTQKWSTRQNTLEVPQDAEIIDLTKDYVFLAWSYLKDDNNYLSQGPGKGE